MLSSLTLNRSLTYACLRAKPVKSLCVRDGLSVFTTGKQHDEPSYKQHFSTALAMKSIDHKKVIDYPKRSKSSVSSDLALILAREIDEETSGGNFGMPEELVELKAEIETQWRIVDESISETGSMIVKMFRKEPGVGGGKISIEFNCQDREDGGSDIVDDDEEELASDIAFDAIITRAGRSLIFSCSTAGTDIVVEEVCIRTADSAANSNDEEFYSGPTLTDLEVDLQESLNSFVIDECGLDENFAAFLNMYADYKEQMEYVQWLKGVHSFVQ